MKLMDKFNYFMVVECKEISKELGINEINLKNVIEQTYYFFNLDLEMFKNDKERIIKVDEQFYYFPFSLSI